MQKKRWTEPLGPLELYLAQFGAHENVREELREHLRDGGDAGLVRAAAVHRLYDLQRPELEKGGLYRPLLTIEMPLVWVLYKMERTGICLNARLYESSKRPLERRLEEVSLHFHATPVQLAHEVSILRLAIFSRSTLSDDKYLFCFACTRISPQHVF